MWNSQNKEQPMWSTHDLACAHCRARKIRCGRERPQCESCKRDGVECRYSSPGKRINHVKLLCQNFEALEDQLNSIQSDLSALTSLVKSGTANHFLPLRPAQDEDYSPSSPYSLSSSPPNPSSRRRGGHVVRNELHAVHRYHGPCSLYALCRDFSDHHHRSRQQQQLNASSPPPSASSSSSSSPSSSPSHEEEEASTRLLLEHMCAEAAREDGVDVVSEQATVYLPPRQFLNIVVGPFFAEADHATDLFSRNHLQAQLDRVYSLPSSQPLGPVDEAWAVCFNVMVLLAMAKDQSAQSNSPFVQPFLQTLRMTVNNPRVFLAPRLVNVQALALLSHIAEQFSPPGFADIVFAQACLLARTMGLHQSRACSSGVDADEALERQKVFRSLYVRDKNLAICRGSSSWLPASEPFLPAADADPDEAKYAPRLELAHIQDDVHRSLHAAAEAPDLPPAKRARLLARLEHRLERWAAAHHVVKKAACAAAAAASASASASTSTEAASLALAFFATRLCVARCADEHDARLSALAASDATVCCLLFLQTTAARPEVRLAESLDQLLGRKRAAPTPQPDEDEAAVSAPAPISASASASAPASASAASASASSSSLGTRPPSLCGSDADPAPSLPRLTAAFPLACIFQLAKTATTTTTTTPEPAPVPRAAAADDQLLLLQSLRDRFAASTDHEQMENLSQKLARTLDTMVRVVSQGRRHHLGRSSPEAAAASSGGATPSIVFNDLSSAASSASQRRGAGGGTLASRKASTPEPDAPFSTAAAAAAGTSSMLLPFMQPFESPRSCSPWPLAGTTASGAAVLGLSPWLGSSYKQQQQQQQQHQQHQSQLHNHHHVDINPRVGKRPRLSSQTELFDVFGDHLQGHGPRADDDPMAMFNFFPMNDDIAVFDGED